MDRELPRTFMLAMPVVSSGAVRRCVLAVAACMSLTGGIACSDSGGGTEPKQDQPPEPPRDSRSLAIEPNPGTVIESTVELFTLWLRSPTGDVEVFEQAQWRVADTSLAKVDPHGFVTGRRAGFTTLHVLRAGRSASIVLTVVPLRNIAIYLDPPERMLPGSVSPLRLRAERNNHTTVYNPPAVWTSSDTTVLSVDSAGKVTAHNPGTATISAAVDTMEATAKIPVYTAASFAMMAGHETTPPSSIMEGDTIRFAARAVRQDGTVVEGLPVRWGVSIGSVASVDADGLVTGLAEGTVRLWAEVDGLTGERSLTVKPRPFNSVIVRGGPRTLLPGSQMKLRAVPVDFRGDTLPPRDAVWTSSDPGVATVHDSSGLVQAVAPGTATITAETYTRPAVGTVTLTVEQPSASSFPIDVRYPTAPHARVALMMDRAIERWERVVTGAEPVATFDIDKDACWEGTPELLNETVRGLLVFVMLDSLDGPRGAVGLAGPCIIGPNELTRVGVIVLDSADVARFLDFGRPLGDELIASLIVHELGHVYGIGALWRDEPYRPNLVTGDNNADPRYIGIHGRDAYLQLGYTENAEETVPVENTGGSGTAGSHWRSPPLGGEALTGWITNSPMALSLVTVGAIRDLGYGVSESGAELFAPGYAARARVSVRMDHRRVDGHAPTEQILRPRYRITRDGRLERLPPR